MNNESRKLVTLYKQAKIEGLVIEAQRNTQTTAIQKTNNSQIKLYNPSDIGLGYFVNTYA